MFRNEVCRHSAAFNDTPRSRHHPPDGLSGKMEALPNGKKKALHSAQNWVIQPNVYGPANHEMKAFSKKYSYFQSAMGQHWMWPLGSSDKTNFVPLSWCVVRNYLPLAGSYPLTALMGHQLCKSCCGDEGCAGDRSVQLKRELVPKQLEIVSSS